MRRHIDKEIGWHTKIIVPPLYSLSGFIATSRLCCKIDKVNGVVSSTRPDLKNALYQSTIKQGDLLLNRLQKLSRVINVWDVCGIGRGSERPRVTWQVGGRVAARAVWRTCHRPGVVQFDCLNERVESLIYICIAIGIAIGRYCIDTIRVRKYSRFPRVLCIN